MIAVQHLTMQLTAAGRWVTILDDVTFDIPDKQMVAIVGPSGSGKSTLLGLIAGLDRPTSGAIWLNGVEIAGLREQTMARLRLATIGYIFSVVSFNSDLDGAGECGGAAGTRGRCGG